VWVAALACTYVFILLPRIQSFSSHHWQASVSAGLLPIRAGGPYAEVSWAYTLLLSISYVGCAVAGMRFMARRRAVNVLVFEFMTVHNFTQCLINVYCLVILVIEAHRLGLGIWGNPLEFSDRGHTLGSMIWLQYHCRQLQLLDTAFMVLRRRFHGISFLHLYLRVLNLWGWYIACRFVCGGEAFFPALMSSVTQALVYGTYFYIGVSEGTPSWAVGRISQLQIFNYVTCALHCCGAAVFGEMPRLLAFLHMFAIANGLILYTDFTSPGGDRMSPKAQRKKKVIFSFDSCGWLMVYHFGFGAFLSEHIPGLQRQTNGDGSNEAPEGVGFSGSSGGALIATVLGTGVNVREVFEYILEQYPLCRKNPTEMFPAVERALQKFQYPGAHARLNGHIRVLLTRVSTRPPFVMGEVADSFSDNDTSIQKICASCHVPFVAGIVPKSIGGRYYYDGLVWPNRLLVPWRGAPGDHVVSVSASGTPFSDVCIPATPYWWALLPPQPRVLRGIYWCGYRDAGNWFLKEPRKQAVECSKRSSASSTTLEEIDEDGFENWRAAQKLLRQKWDGKLPEKDPITGEDVQELIREAERLGEVASKMLLWSLAAGAVVVTSLVVALDPVAAFWPA